MILLDVGNTYTKWEVAFDREAPCGSFFTRNLLGGVTSLIDAYPQERAILASWVGKAEARPAVQQRLAARGIAFEVAVSRREQLGLINGYEDPDKLGVDRWLAMLGLWHCNRRPFCVVDAGTALTMDFVDASGRHLGGYIVPGVRTMITSLNVATAQIDCTLINNDEIEWQPAKNTTDAVQRGVMVTLAGAIEYASARVAKQYDLNDIDCFVGGGDGALLATLLGPQWQMEKSLVIAGLKAYLLSDPT